MADAQNTATREIIRRAAKLALYRKDFPTFAAEQLKVAPKDPGPLKPLTLNPPQRLIESIVSEQLKEYGWIRVCILKSRQQGCSTWASGRGFHGTALNPNVNNLVLAQDKETAGAIFEINRLFHDNLEEEIRPLTRYATKNALVFENPDEKTRSQYPGLRSRTTFATANNIHSGIGKTVHRLHLSECSKYPNADLVMQSLFPTVPNAPGTSIILESTAFPLGDWFHDFCQRAQSGQDVYKFIFIPWFISPEYRMPLRKGEKLKLDAEELHMQKAYGLDDEQLLFRRRQIEQWSSGSWPNVEQQAVDRFSCEYASDADSAWVSWDTSAFDKTKMHELKKMVTGPRRRCEIMNSDRGPLLHDNHMGKLWIWKEPEPGRLYDIGADPAGGTPEGDWSVAQVFDRKAREQVAEYRHKIGPLDFAEVLSPLGYYYNTAQIGVEVDGVGFATNDALVKSGYANCLASDQRVLTADLRWLPVGELEVGQKLVGFDEHRPTPITKRRYLSSEVVGLEHRRAEVFRLILSDGTELKATAEHPWIVSGESGGQRWRRTHELRRGRSKLPRFFDPWRELSTYDAGWMAGILDGEGSVGHYRSNPAAPRGTSGPQLSIAQKPGQILDRARELLSRWDVRYNLTGPDNTSGAHHIQIGRKSDVARVLGMTRPIRLLTKFLPEWFSRLCGESRATVEARESLGIQDIVTFGTTTKTYIAEGFASHNCYIWRMRGKAAPTMSSWTGWKSQPDAKRYMISLMRHRLMHDEIIIRSPILWDEMMHYSVIQYDSGERYRHASGHHDDCVSAAAIAIVIGEDEDFGAHPKDVLFPKKDPVDPMLVDQGMLPSERGGSPLDALIDNLRGWD